jgi:hypothetical protein
VLLGRVQSAQRVLKQRAYVNVVAGWHGTHLSLVEGLHIVDYHRDFSIDVWGNEAHARTLTPAVHVVFNTRQESQSRTFWSQRTEPVILSRERRRMVVSKWCQVYIYCELHNNRPKTAENFGYQGQLENHTNGVEARRGSNFRLCWLEPSRFFITQRTIEKRGDQSRFKCRKMANWDAIRSNVRVVRQLLQRPDSASEQRD